MPVLYSGGHCGFYCAGIIFILNKQQVKLWNWNDLGLNIS